MSQWFARFGLAIKILAGVAAVAGAAGVIAGGGVIVKRYQDLELTAAGQSAKIEALRIDLQALQTRVQEMQASRARRLADVRRVLDEWKEHETRLVRLEALLEAQMFGWSPPGESKLETEKSRQP